MAKFMALYTGKPESQMPDEAAIERGMRAWGDWMEKNKASIVETGGPLGKTKKVGPDGVSDISNTLAGYVIVEAADHEAAARLFEGHPHFTIFPGDGVEVMPCLPIPTMEDRISR